MSNGSRNQCPGIRLDKLLESVQEEERRKASFKHEGILFGDLIGVKEIAKIPPNNLGER
jgi:hypothetical protein